MGLIFCISSKDGAVVFSKLRPFAMAGVLSAHWLNQLIGEISKYIFSFLQKGELMTSHCTGRKLFPLKRD